MLLVYQEHFYHRISFISLFSVQEPEAYIECLNECPQSHKVEGQEYIPGGCELNQISYLVNLMYFTKYLHFSKVVVTIYSSPIVFILTTEIFL